MGPIHEVIIISYEAVGEERNKVSLDAEATIRGVGDIGSGRLLRLVSTNFLDQWQIWEDGILALLVSSLNYKVQWIMESYERSDLRHIYH